MKPEEEGPRLTGESCARRQSLNEQSFDIQKAGPGPLAEMWSAVGQRRRSSHTTRNLDHLGSSFVPQHSPVIDGGSVAQ